MAAPRPIIPGKRYLLTRRCADRRFRLRPSVIVNVIYLYCLARAARKTGVLIHAFCLMSNHHHVAVTDVEGRLPDFARELHRLMAKAVNALQGRWENLWCNEQFHILELGDDEQLVDALAYVIANPVAAGLVQSPSEWPGALQVPVIQELTRKVDRPEVYFRRYGSCSRTVELTVTPLAHIPGFAARFADALAARVEKARKSMASRGLRFLGAARVMKNSFMRRAKRIERRMGLTPRVAARSMFVKRAMLESLRWFRFSYHLAMTRWRAGDREAVFPWGTWWMSIFHDARTEGPAPPDVGDWQFA